MGPLIDAELESVDRSHAQLTKLSADLVNALALYHTLMREPEYQSANKLPYAYAPHHSQPGPVVRCIYIKHQHLLRTIRFVRRCIMEACLRRTRQALTWEVACRLRLLLAATTACRPWCSLLEGPAPCQSLGWCRRIRIFPPPRYRTPRCRRNYPTISAYRWLAGSRNPRKYLLFIYKVKWGIVYSETKCIAGRFALMYFKWFVKIAKSCSIRIDGDLSHN